LLVGHSKEWQVSEKDISWQLLHHHREHCNRKEEAVSDRQSIEA